MKKIKRVLLGAIIGIFTIAILGNSNIVKAETAGPLYLGIIALRSSGYGYMQGEKKVWKIAEYSSLSGTTPDLSQSIYCIHAGPGFGSADMDTVSPPAIRAYTQRFNLKDTSGISSVYTNILPTGENYNKLIWLLDHLYLTGDNNSTKREAFLANLIPGTFYETLTDDDIDVVQQLAIWYFTNPSGTYHYPYIELYMNARANENTNYRNLDDLFTSQYLSTDYTVGEARQEAAKELYLYYINNAQANYTSTSTSSNPIELIRNNAIMQTIGSNYVAGPYKINELLNRDYTLTPTFYNANTSTQITPKIGIKSGENIIETNQTIKQLAESGTEFYLMMPTSSNINGITMNIATSYTSKTATYWSVVNAPSTEQPVVIINQTPYNFSNEATLVIERPFDLSLRKFITELNGVSVTSREPIVEVTPLVDGSDTTAIYNHSKDPIRVEVGDIITYTIRVYNEGNIDGYVTEITDHIPAQLEYIVDDQINIEYGWQLQSGLRTVKTNYLSKANERTSGGNKLDAFNGTTLDYLDVKIRCRVINTSPMANKITNLAEITAFTDGDGNTVTDRDSQGNNVNLPTGTDLENYKDSEINRGEDYIEGQQDDDDFEKLILKKFDLALRKYITKVNNVSVENTREPNIVTTSLSAGTSTTAVYNHRKDPVSVETGDIVTYNISIYNEGETIGRATKIVDQLPTGLIFSKLNTTGFTADYNQTTNTLTLTRQTSNTQNLSAFINGDLSSETIEIECEVTAQIDPQNDVILTNVAYIAEEYNAKSQTIITNEVGEDIDSEPNTMPSVNKDNMQEYKGNTQNKEVKPGDSTYYYKGEQDDDDFEKLVLKTKKFDLSLRKFIVGVNDEIITERMPSVDTTPLEEETLTTAIYNHSKSPVRVKIGDIVTYAIRVYNEGDIDGYVNEITDHLPPQLEFIVGNEVNEEFGWAVDASNSKIIRTTYLSNANGAQNIISAFDGTRLSYKTIKVVCKVVETDPMASKITNIADISAFVDKDGNAVIDRDSQEDNVIIPSDLPGYNDDKINRDYIPGQQDDDDFEKLIIEEFDLALRKFITGVNTTLYTNRYPVFSIDENGNYIYTHTKEPVLVSNGCIVTYTIRVYNEGNINGYAKEVKDDIPQGLEYLPDNEINIEYRWIMLDKDGNKTTDVTKATSISTDYLSKEQEKTDKGNLLLSFNENTMQEPAYKDLKIAFLVTEPNTSDRIIINQAQISDDSDENDNEVKDKDSTPDEWIEGEDDQDIEKIKVQYFDLSLRKWVTEAILIENGETTVTQTGHHAEDDPEAIVKVDLKKKKLNTVTVKFRYSVRVTNEGQIAGYVKEIKDHIPQGLKFIAEDNPLWIAIDNNTITTDQAKDILLKPGESTEVTVLLTWINSENNLGAMKNVAEISKDYNEFNAPDIDSVPDNEKEGEDDIDDATVMLSIATGEIKRYTLLVGGILIILSGGIILIKKIVL